MFSYRHAFHAGNHADVLKHAVLVQLLHYFTQKDKPFMFLDTHAGGGMYALDSAFAKKNAEFENGISRLWKRKNLPALLDDYVKEIRALNQAGNLRYYPGSPQLARQILRRGDQLRLYELHPSEIKVLQKNLGLAASIQGVRGNRPPKQIAGPRILVEYSDGFAGLKSALPPTQRRALVLIDPSYEDKNDYAHVLRGLREAIQRFPIGTYAVWYPQVQRNESRRFAEQLIKLPVQNWLHVSLCVQAPAESGLGLHGSAMYLINPPWTLPTQLEASMPFLTQTLAQDEHASFSLSYELA